jgi:hypothetical protein
LLPGRPADRSVDRSISNPYGYDGDEQCKIEVGWNNSGGFWERELRRREWRIGAPFPCGGLFGWLQDKKKAKRGFCGSSDGGRRRKLPRPCTKGFDVDWTRGRPVDGIRAETGNVERFLGTCRPAAAAAAVCECICIRGSAAARR